MRIGLIGLIEEEGERMRCIIEKAMLLVLLRVMQMQIALKRCWDAGKKWKTDWNKSQTRFSE